MKTFGGVFEEDTKKEPQFFLRLVETGCGYTNLYAVDGKGETIPSGCLLRFEKDRDGNMKVMSYSGVADSLRISTDSNGRVDVGHF